VLADEEGRSRPLDPRRSLAVDLHHASVVERDDVQTEEPDPLTGRAVDDLRRRLAFEEVQRARRGRERDRPDAHRDRRRDQQPRDEQWHQT
jgi:hypothetical protein